MPQFDLSSFCLQNTIIIFSFYYLYNICLTLLIPFTGFLLKTRNRLSKFKKIGKAFSSSIVKWNTFLKSEMRLAFFLTKVQTEDRSFSKFFLSYILLRFLCSTFISELLISNFKSKNIEKVSHFTISSPTTVGEDTVCRKKSHFLPSVGPSGKDVSALGQ